MVNILKIFVGWFITAIVLAIALFVFFMSVLFFGSMITMENLFTVETVQSLTTFSIAAGGVLAIILILLDFKGFKNAIDVDDWN